MVRGTAHAVAFTYMEGKPCQRANTLQFYEAAEHTVEPYCVGVLQAAVFPLIQDVQTSALIIRTVGSTGDLTHRGKQKQKRDLESFIDRPETDGLFVTEKIISLY